MFKNIFYRFYSFFKYTEDNFAPESLRMPQHITVFFFMILIILNIGTFVLLFKEYVNLKIILNKIEIIAFIIFIYLCFYFLFIHKKKYLKIAEKYKEETKTKRVLGISLALSYIVFTIVFLVIVASNR